MTNSHKLAFRLSGAAAAAVVCAAALTGCEEKTAISSAEAEEAVWRQIGPRSTPACSPYTGPHSTANPEQCEADKKSQRETFSLSLDECSNGSTIGDFADAITCTVTYQRGPDTSERSRVYIFHKSAGEWIAVPV